MDIPQNIKDTLMIRPDYTEWIERETAIFAYLDLTNMFHWQDRLGWKFRIEDVIAQLLSYSHIKEVKVYYGLNEREKANAEAFHNRVKKAGAILRTKPVKFIHKDIGASMFFQRRTLTLFDGAITDKIDALINELRASNVYVEEPKCNFDVEMAMDVLDDAEKMSAILLFSGDSDFVGPLERLKVKGKRIGVVGIRGSVAAELHQVKDKYFDFGKLYTGKRVHTQNAKIPPLAGPRV